MSYKPGDALEVYFTTADPATGGAVDADSLPTARLMHNGAVDGAVTLTVAGTGTAGEYRVTGTVPSSGYVSGHRISVLAAAVVSGVTGRASLGTWVLDSKRVGDLDAATPGNVMSAQAAIIAALPVDYQQRGVAVLLPDSAPDGYGGTGLTTDQAAQLAAIKARTDLITAAVQVSSQVALDGNTLSARTGDQWLLTLTGLGSLADVEKLWFGLKSDAEPALLLIEQGDGLSILNGGVYPTAGDGEIVIVDADTGRVTITVKAAVTLQIVAQRAGLRWALKVRRSGAAVSRVVGVFVLQPAIVAAV